MRNIDYSYLQNIRPLAATLHSAFLFTCGVVQIELIQIQSVTMSQLNGPIAGGCRTPCAHQWSQRSLLHDTAPNAECPASIERQCFHHVCPPGFYLSLSFMPVTTDLTC